MAAYSAFCVSDSPANAFLVSFTTSDKSLILPWESVIDILSFFIAASDSLVGFAILVNQERVDVPACEALIPLFAINPRTCDTSSMLYFIDPAIGATNLKDSPIMPTFVFADAAVFARTSAKWVESFACSPNAVSASVTISEVVPSSSPEAAAKSIIPFVPASISFVFQPAMAIYSMASPDCVAVKTVVAPICSAFAVKASKSDPVAPDIAFTVDIWLSKSIPTLTDAAVAVAIAAAATLAVFATAENAAVPTLFTPASPCLVSAIDIFQSVFIDFDASAASLAIARNSLFVYFMEDGKVFSISPAIRIAILYSLLFADNFLSHLQVIINGFTQLKKGQSQEVFHICPKVHG